MRRYGRPGLVGTMARTAVIAGTASATMNAVNGHAQQKQAAAQQQAYEQQQQQAAAQQQTAQQQTAQQQAAQQADATASQDDLVDQLKQLAALNTAGVLSDAEFATAKAKLLGT